MLIRIGQDAIKPERAPQVLSSSSLARASTLDQEHRQSWHCHPPKRSSTPSEQEPKKRYTSRTSSLKLWATSASTSASTQTAQQENQWRRAKGYQSVQSTSNSNSCSSRTSSKEAWYLCTRSLAKTIQQTSLPNTWQQKCWDGSSTAQVSTHSNTKLQQVSPVSPVCKTYISKQTSASWLAMVNKHPVAIFFVFTHLDFFKKYQRTTSYSCTFTWYYMIVYIIYILFDFVFWTSFGSPWTSTFASDFCAGNHRLKTASFEASFCIVLCIPAAIW